MKEYLLGTVGDLYESVNNVYIHNTYSEKTSRLTIDNLL